MKLLKKMMFSIFMSAMLISLVGCSGNTFSEKETKYYIAYSDIFKSDGLLCGIDEDGNYTSMQKINLQDGTNAKLINGITIIGGERANTHLLVDKDGSYKEFYLLDKPNYTGVCAITYDGDRIISSMNGGFSDGVYLNLLVVQDVTGNVEVKETIEIYAEDILYFDNTVYIVGAMDYAGEDEGWIGKIISYDLNNGEISEQQFEAKKPFLNIQCLNDKLYCSVDTLNSGCYEIYILDKNTLEKTGSLTFTSNIDGFLAYEGKLYCVIGGEFCEINSDDGTTNKKIYTLPNDSYIEHTAAYDGKIYITTRFDTPRDGENDPIVGTQTEFKLSDNSFTEIPIQMNRKKYSFFVVSPVT